jgi:hypothetical protein
VALEQTSTAEQYSAFFMKHLSRFLLGPHLLGVPAFGDVRGSSYLQAAKLLGETILAVEAEKLKGANPYNFFVPPALLRVAESIAEQGRFDAAKLQKMTARPQDSV